MLSDVQSYFIKKNIEAPYNTIITSKSEEMRHLEWFFAFHLFHLVTTADFPIKNYGRSNPDSLVKYCKMFKEPSKVTSESLTRLQLSVMAKSGAVTPYDYFHVAGLVHHSDVDFKRKTFVFVGTYMDLTSFPLGETMAKLYLQLGYNALLLHYVDNNWRNFPIPAAARHMRPVSRYAAQMLANLTTLGLDPKQLELVGYGFGGQTMSFVAKDYRDITGKNISMLIGLDPAGPCFRTLGPKDRLDPSDADFVMSIGTNIDGHGMATPMGHVTFYVNGGEFQPADVWFMPCGIDCSHIRAYYLWLSALLNPGRFIGLKCDSIQQAREHDCFDTKPKVTNTMDMEVNKNKTGIFYLVTTNRYPYARGKGGISKKSVVATKQFTSFSEVLTI